MNLGSLAAGTYKWQARAKDGLGNTSAFTAFASGGAAFTVVTSSITGSISINGGAPYTAGSTVTLTLSASSSLGTVTQMRFSNDGSNWTAYEAFATSKSAHPLTPGDGSKTVRVQFLDSTGATTQLSDSIVLDTVPPVISSFAVGNGAAAVSSSTVSLSFVVSDAASGVQSREVSNDSVTWTLMNTPGSWSLVAGEGVRTVQLRVTDNAGNTTSSQDSVIVDTTPPTLTGISINGGATATNNVNVQISSAASDSGGSGVTELSLANEANPFGAFVARGAISNPHVLVNTDGVRTVRARVRDAAGNESSEATSTITLSTTAPNGSVVINNGDSYTRVTPVTLTLTSSTATSYCAKTSGATPAASDPCFVAMAASAPLTLSGADGVKTVNVWFKDVAGNVSSPVSDTIQLDRAVPTVSVVGTGAGLASGRVSVNVTTIAFDHVASDPSPSSGIAQVCTGDTVAAVDCVPYSNAPTIVLPASETSHVRYIRVVDNAGNSSVAHADSISYDVTPPVVSSVMINNNVASTNSTSVSVSTTVSDANPLSGGTIELSNDGSTFTPYAYASPRTWVLTAGEGPKTVTVRVTDSAGNVSVAPYATDGIVLDQSAPVATLDVEAGKRYANTAAVPLTITPSDMSAGLQMYIEVRLATATAPTAPGTFVPFASPATVNLTTGGQGDKRIYVFLRDAAGNVTPAPRPSYLIGYDTIEPTLSSALAVNAGAVGTNVGTVALNYGATDPSGIALSEASADGSTFATIIGPGATVAINTTEPEGARTLSLRLTDGAGNVTTVTDAIIYDVTPPVVNITGAGLGLSAGAAYTRFTYATFNHTATDNLTGVVTVCVGITTATTNCVPYGVGVPDLTLTSGDGLKTAYIKVIDGAGNESGLSSDTITLDTVPPTITSVVINGGATTTSTNAVSVAVTAADNNAVATLRLSNNGGATYSSQTFLGGGVDHPHFIPSPDGLKPVHASVADGAGNIATPSVVDTITLDTPPTVYVYIPPYTNTSPLQVPLSSNQQCVEVAYVVQDAALPPPSTPTTFTAMSIGTTTVQLPVDVSAGGEGSKRIYIWLKDTSGNISTTPGSGTTWFDVTQPTTPIVTGLKASHRKLTASYTSASDPGGSGVTSYEIGWSFVSGGPYSFSPPQQPGPTVTAYGLANDYTHFVVVRAVDNAGNRSGSSSELSGRPYWSFEWLSQRPMSGPAFGLGYLPQTDQYFYGGPYGALFASADMGTWTRRDPMSDYEVRSFHVDPDGAMWAVGGAGPQGGSGFASRSVDGAYFQNMLPSSWSNIGVIEGIVHAGTTGSPAASHYVMVGGNVLAYGVKGATQATPTWSLASSPGASAFFAVTACKNGPSACAGDSVVIAAGREGSVIRSTDRGVTWAKASMPSAYASPFPDEWRCRSLAQVPNSDTLYLGCEYTGWSASARRGLLVSTNGGVSWAEVTAWPTQDVWGLTMVGADLWIAAETSTNAGAVYKLPAATGTGFVDITPAGLSGIAYQLSARSATDVALTASRHDASGRREARLWRTTNAGASWANPSAGIQSSLSGMESPDGTTFVASAGDGSVWRSADAARTWTQVLTPPTPTSWVLQAIDLVDGSATGTGFAVGMLGRIFKTTNGGLTWAEDPQSRTVTSSNLTAVKCRGAMSCVAVGERRQIITWDGATWSVQPAAPNANDTFTAVENYLDSSNVPRVFVTSTNRHFVRFDGTSWTEGTLGSLPTSTVPQRLQAKKDGAGIMIMGTQGVPYRSTDHGQSWTPVGTRAAGLVEHVAGTSVWYGVAPETAVTLKSTDDGLTWAYQRTEPNEQGIWPATRMSAPMTAIVAPSANELFVAGPWGTVLHSATGGE